MLGYRKKEEQSYLSDYDKLNDEGKYRLESMFNGIMHLVVAYGDKLRDDLFKEKVGAISIKEIVRTAKERRQGSVGYADVMLTYYNKQMKNPLQWMKLRQAPKKIHSPVGVIELNELPESQTELAVPDVAESETTQDGNGDE